LNQEDTNNKQINKEIETLITILKKTPNKEKPRTRGIHCKVPPDL
jgi:hypothetical protein